MPVCLGGCLCFVVSVIALTGTIPNELSAMEKLELVYLNSNSLSGSIPRGIGAWKQMSNLYLDQNMLTGEIPSELGDLVQLTHLYLYDNVSTTLHCTVPCCVY